MILSNFFMAFAIWFATSEAVMWNPSCFAASKALPAPHVY